MNQAVDEVHSPESAIDISLPVNHKARVINTSRIRRSSWGKMIPSPRETDLMPFLSEHRSVHCAFCYAAQAASLLRNP
jgi:hypothetical protein